MTITADDFRALARSSPWLWRTLTCVVTPAPGDTFEGEREPLRVVTNRDGALDVRRLDDTLVKACPADADSWSERERLLALAVRRSDGLVAERPDNIQELDVSLIQSYLWVAITDPRELADTCVEDTSPPVVEDAREFEASGRTVWGAVLTPDVEGYDPRCPCCPLLSGRAARQIEQWPENWRELAETGATRFEVWLDRATGVVVHLRHCDGATAGDGFDIEIEAASL